ncbi:MAG: sugar ABC transporter ATP-binding protein [Coprococcus sp.]|nr:sugar ABC transporter ATP-binding protein [Coprococcus sp.]
MNEQSFALRTEDVYKSFGGNHVLKGINFELYEGEVQAVLGINGAGKSTLIKIISGALAQDKGEVVIGEQAIKNLTPQKAQTLGIATIYQETSLYPKLSVLENLFVGKRLKKHGRLDWKGMEEKARDIFDRLGVELDPYEKMENLGKASAQLVEIAKALTINARILIMDEPTSSLSKQETERLFDIVRKLKKEGASIIYISHRMEEIFQITDRVTVMRDGKIIGTKKTEEATTEWITMSMLGKEVNASLEKKERSPGEVLLDIQGLSSGQLFHDISFQVRRGEIVVLSGLVGAGRTEVMRAVFGIDAYDSGKICFKGEPVKKHTWDVIRQGIVMVPEDRGRQGFIKEVSAAENMVMAALPEISRGGFRNQEKEKEYVEGQVKGLLLNPPTAKLEGGSYSGGNQQKIVIGKWLNTHPELLILDEPTCGVDVGAKMEIYKLIIRLAEEGKGILIVSSDIEETEMIADRIIIMRQGAIVGELSGEAEKDAILGLALAGIPSNASLNSPEVDGPSDNRKLGEGEKGHV